MMKERADVTNMSRMFCDLTRQNMRFLQILIMLASLVGSQAFFFTSNTPCGQLKRSPLHLFGAAHRTKHQSYFFHIRADSSGSANEGSALGKEFQKEAGRRLAGQFSTTLFRNSAGGIVTGTHLDPHYRLPSALLPPHRAVQVQLEALQMNDYPEVDDGCRHAYRYAVRGNNVLFGSLGKPFVMQRGKTDPSIHRDRVYVDASLEDRHLAKDWSSQQLLDEQGFVSMLHSKFSMLIGTLRWEWCAPPSFNSQGDTCVLQVRVDASDGRTYLITFNQRMIEDGAYKGCWMTDSVVCA